MEDPESHFRGLLKESTPEVKEAFEKLAQSIRSLDPAVLSYLTDRPDIRYTTSDVPRTSRGHHPFVHISPGKTRLEVHLKSVDDPKHITMWRSISKTVLEKHFRSLPKKTSLKSASDVDDYLTGLLKQSLWIMRKDFS